MIQIDRTVKMLLGAIVIVLAIIAFKPFFDVVPSALAQTTAQQTMTLAQLVQLAQTAPLNAYNQLDLGYTVPQPSIIQVPQGQYVREIQVIDSAHAFLVRYDNRIEVYRIQTVMADKTQLEQRIQQLQNSGATNATQ